MRLNPFWIVCTYCGLAVAKLVGFLSSPDSPCELQEVEDLTGNKHSREKPEVSTRKHGEIKDRVTQCFKVRYTKLSKNIRA